VRRRGTIRRRGRNSWQIKAAGRDPLTGKYRPVFRTVRGTEQKAQRALTALIADIDKGVLADPGAMTLGRYLSEEWLPAISRVAKTGRPLAPTTRDRYMGAVEKITPTTSAP
jgi:hypothetical protein